MKTNKTLDWRFISLVSHGPEHCDTSLMQNTEIIMR